MSKTGYPAPSSSHLMNVGEPREKRKTMDLRTMQPITSPVNMLYYSTSRELHKARAGNRRGGWYWRAYRRKRGLLSRCYLGVPTNLTLAKLREAARCLAADGEGMGKSQTEEDTPPPVPVLLASQGLMSTVILQSTITPPRLPVQHVERPRLLALLEQGLRGPVTLVSAPAGSGKTTLLAEWAATTTRPVAWLSCEEGENDPARFLSSLIAALACVDARLDTTAQTE